MKVLVTGGTGFIGKRLVERLKALGHEVVCTVRQNNCLVFLSGVGAKTAFCDITDLSAVLKLFEKEKADVVFHCAARVKNTERDLTFKTNVGGTRNICEACLRSRTKRLVYLSTIALVSGNPVEKLTDDLPYCPTNEIYGVSKMEAEKIVIEYRGKGLKSAIIRPCMVVGEGEPHAVDGMLKLIKKRLVPIPEIMGLVDRLHLLHVDNLVHAMELAMTEDAALEGTFLAADKEVISAIRFIELCYEELGVGKPARVPEWMVRIALFFPPAKRLFDKVFKPREYDISRLVNLLGYDPPVRAEEGVRRMVRHWNNEQRRLRCPCQGR